MPSVERDVATRHHALGRLEKLIECDTVGTRRASPHEKGATILGGIAVPNTFAPAPITLPVVRPQADAGLGVIAEQRAEELHARVARAAPASTAATLPYVFFRLLVIVPAPRLTQRPRYGVADEAVVRLVGVAEEDRLADLAVHLARVADRRHRDAVAADDGVLARRSSGPTSRVNALHVRARADAAPGRRWRRSTRSARRRRRARRTPAASPTRDGARRSASTRCAATSGDVRSSMRRGGARMKSHTSSIHRPWICARGASGRANDSSARVAVAQTSGVHGAVQPHRGDASVAAPARRASAPPPARAARTARWHDPAPAGIVSRRPHGAAPRLLEVPQMPATRSSPPPARRARAPIARASSGAPARSSPRGTRRARTARSRAPARRRRDRCRSRVLPHARRAATSSSCLRSAARSSVVTSVRPSRGDDHQVVHAVQHHRVPVRVHDVVRATRRRARRRRRVAVGIVRAHAAQRRPRADVVPAEVAGKHEHAACCAPARRRRPRSGCRPPRRSRSRSSACAASAARPPACCAGSSSRKSPTRQTKIPEFQR